MPLAIVSVLALVVVAAVIWVSSRDAPSATLDIPTDGLVKGAQTAPVTIEEWADFQCPACRAMTRGVGRRLDETAVKAGIVKVVWRDLAFLGPESIWAAEAARCANDQGKFWVYHEKLYAEQSGENRGAFARENLKRFANDIGLDRATFDTCLDSDRHLAEVRADTQDGRQRGVAATPTLFVNGRKIEGVPSQQELDAAIAAARAG